MEMGRQRERVRTTAKYGSLGAKKNMRFLVRGGREGSGQYLRMHSAGDDEDDDDCEEKDDIGGGDGAEDGGADGAHQDDGHHQRVHGAQHRGRRQLHAGRGVQTQQQVGGRHQQRQRVGRHNTDLHTTLQFNVESMHSEKPVCAPPLLSKVSPSSPLKRFQCSPD